MHVFNVILTWLCLKKTAIQMKKSNAGTLPTTAAIVLQRLLWLQYLAGGTHKGLAINYQSGPSHLLEDAHHVN